MIQLYLLLHDLQYLFDTAVIVVVWPSSFELAVHVDVWSLSFVTSKIDVVRPSLFDAAVIVVAWLASFDTAVIVAGPHFILP